MCSQEPALQKGNGQMNTREQVFIALFLSLGDSDLMNEAVRFQWGISPPTVGNYEGPGGNVVLDEGNKAGRGPSPPRTEVGSDRWPFEKGSLFPQRLLSEPSSVPVGRRHLFLHLRCRHRPLQRGLVEITTVANHTPLELMKPCPSGLIVSELKLPLQAFGAASGLLRRNPPHGLKPLGDWFPGPMKQGSTRYRNLPTATTTFHQALLEQPILTCEADRTHEALWPTDLNEVTQAILFTIKEVGKFRRIFCVVFCIHGTAYYILWSPESSGYPGPLFIIHSDIVSLPIVRSQRLLLIARPGPGMLFE